ncbi:hypothetical protein KGO95_00960 [Patescibacteria group bacterium]|nr:hypothetical protein [Patescibacteria group bacterium]
MKNIALSIAIVIGCIAIGFVAVPLVRNFYVIGGDRVAPYQLNDHATEFGELQVSVTGFGLSPAGVEVDVGTPGGRKTVMQTDDTGTATFVNVPVGSWTVFFNPYTFPKAYPQSSANIQKQVTITQGMTTNVTIDLGQGQ